jgi:pyrimidine-nucleoside phosphorylase
MLLGGGRAKKTDSIDYGVGIVLEKKVGELVNEGDTILTLHINNEEKINEVIKILDEAFCYEENEVKKEPLIAKVIG